MSFLNSSEDPFQQLQTAQEITLLKFTSYEE